MAELNSINLNDPRWATFNGAYGTLYDVSIILKELEAASTPEDMLPIFEELWEELHHQGDVNIASYLALPQLVRICQEKHLADWNILAICATIEQQRHHGNNPKLPEEYADYYNNGLTNLKSLALSILEKSPDQITFRATSSALATASGHVKLGKAIMELEGSVLDEFLEQF